MKNYLKNNLLKMENKFEFITDKKSIFKYFLVYALLNALLLYYIHDIIITDPQYFTGGNMNSVALFRKLWKVIYFLSPVYEFIKILVISFLIYQAIRIVKKLNTQFWGIFYIVLIAQFILLIPDFMELIWFTFIKIDYSMVDVDYFNPLSVANLMDYQNISNFTYKLIESINLFNITYWGLLLYLIKKYVDISLKDSFIVVFCFYGLMSFIFSFIHLFGIYKMSYGF